jgi:acetylornithine/succinyldiaminopimelate/putrescine aminotransferase
MNAELAPSRSKTFTGPPIGLLRADANGYDVIDTLAGADSVFGFGQPKLIEAAIQAAEDSFTFAKSNASSAQSLLDLIHQVPAPPCSTEIVSVHSFAHRDLAIESAIHQIRSRHHGRRYRTIAMVGSDHGRTGVCRTASGLPALASDYGPMMAGFAHVKSGDLDAIAANIDDQTGAILISPIQTTDAAKPLERSFLEGVRDLCDQHDLLLVLDESEIVFGSCGSVLATTSIADIRVDLAIVAAGLFAGMPGGLLLSSLAFGDTDADPTQPDLPAFGGHNRRISDAVAEATLQQMTQQNLWAIAAETARDLAVQIAETVAGDAIVRDIHPLGTSIGIEIDHDSKQVFDNASHFGLQVADAGPHAVRMALPLVVNPDDVSEMLRRMTETLEATTRSSMTADV